MHGADRARVFTQSRAGLKEGGARERASKAPCNATACMHAMGCPCRPSAGLPIPILGPPASAPLPACSLGNRGSGNVGHHNVGDGNLGSRNLGSRNLGDMNSGARGGSPALSLLSHPAAACSAAPCALPALAIEHGCKGVARRAACCCARRACSAANSLPPCPLKPPAADDCVGSYNTRSGSLGTAGSGSLLPHAQDAAAS